jgi:hypothetical protein
VNESATGTPKVYCMAIQRKKRKFEKLLYSPLPGYMAPLDSSPEVPLLSNHASPYLFPSSLYSLS